jgi:hypothetical protein
MGGDAGAAYRRGRLQRSGSGPEVAGTLGVLGMIGERRWADCTGLPGVGECHPLVTCPPLRAHAPGGGAVRG